MKTIRILFLLYIPSIAFAQQELLRSGPMVGYSDMREVMLWVQTKKKAKVKFYYFEKSNPKVKFETDEVATEKKTVYTAKCIADRVQPGRKYMYELYIDGKKVSRPYPLEFQSQFLWQWRTDPPNFKFALGSCAYINDSTYDRPGKPYGGEYEIFESIYKQKPDFMLWTGDNVYLREADWTTRTGVLYRYTHTRSLPEMQPLLGSVHHYAIWDDHDFGPNDSDGAFPYKDITLEAFKMFWCNPNYVLGEEEGIAGTFSWGDAQFFLLDDRWFRTANSNTLRERNHFGKKQIDWLLNSLSSSKATFKFLVCGGQVLNPSVKYEDYSFFAEEKEKLLKSITDLKISGVIFLTGDRHHTEISALPRTETYPLYDFTISPLTSETHRASDEGNFLQVPETLVLARNFGIIEISGPAKDRLLTLSIFKSNGEFVWKREFKASDLK